MPFLHTCLFSFWFTFLIIDGCTDGFEDWNTNSEFCYQWPPEKLSWPDARDFCSSINGDLAVIKDNATMTNILHYSSQESTWIGLKKDQLADSTYQTAFNTKKL